MTHQPVMYLRSTVKPLAVSSKSRQAIYPNLPAVSESGIAALDSFDMQSWFALFVPAATPAPALARLRAEMAKANERCEEQSDSLRKELRMLRDVTIEGNLIINAHLHDFVVRRDYYRENDVSSRVFKSVFANPVPCGLTDSLPEQRSFGS